MNEVTFLQNFKLVANAPGGVQRLRELVLQLAAMGRLVQRVASEGDSEPLVAAISNERERLADEGGVRLTSPLPDVDPGSQSVSVPDHWRWIRLGNLTSKIGSGSTPRGGSKVYVSDGVPFLRSQNIWNDGVRLDDVVFISAETHAKMRNTHVLPNDILLNITGASLGRCAIAPVDFPAANVSQHVTIIRPLLTETRRFLHICLLSPFGQGMIWGRQVGMAREGLSKKVLEQFEIPLPPLEEQKRIVAKVDELMRLCDRLEAQQQERQKLLPLLSRANHTRFVAEPTTGSLQAIFHQPGAAWPSELRKSILELAVRGVLVPQMEPADSVDDLLESIATERQAVGRRESALIPGPSPVDTLRFDIPSTWRWQELDRLLIAGPTNGISPKAVETETPVRSLTLSATTSGRFRGEHTKFISNEVPPDSDLWLEDGDILVQRGNTAEYVGVPAVYHGAPRSYIYPDLMMRIRVAKALDVDFIHLAMSAEPLRNFLRDRATGTAGTMPKINHGTLKSLPIPIPPAAEQQQIVARVRQLMAIVDRLEQKLNDKQTTAESFARAAVAAITSNEITENERMKPPKTEVVTALKLGKKPKKAEAALLATLLSEQKAEASAKTLWQLSGLEIDAFYRQLKTEMANGWITEPEKAFVKEVEAL